MLFAKTIRFILFLLMIGLSVLAPAQIEAEETAVIHIIKIEAVINPVSADYIVQSINEAVDAGATAMIIELDTPGGLMASMRQIVKAELEAKIPIIVYVSPSGSRAGSAGVFITMAAHIAVMDNGTNIGAAHPVGIGGSSPDSGSAMWDKVTNDAVAQIRSIADKRNRNADWAEKAVVESASITETVASAEYRQPSYNDTWGQRQY